MIRKRHVVLEFRRSELLYDIRNIAYSVGESRDAEADNTDAKDDGKVKSQIQDICEDGNIDFVTRILDTAHDECVEILYAFTKEAIEPAAWADDELKETKVYRVSMVVPESFSQTTVNLLMKYIHDYMVAKVLAEHLSIVESKSAAIWVGKVLDLKASMETCLNKRMTRVRRTMTPFG